METIAGEKPIKPLSIMVVDDEPVVIELLSLFVADMGGLEFHGFTSPIDSLKWAKENHFDIALVDYIMPGMTGLELARVLKTKSPESYYLIMTAYGELEVAVEAIRIGVFDFVSKPIERKDLELAIGRVLKHRKLKDQNIVLRSLLREGHGKGQLIGKSNDMESTREKIRLFTQSDAPVLITGETGVGKEVVARMIHQSGKRSRSRFVAVNCSTYVETLLESELFGHEKGSFTGADRQRIGRLEFAQSGSLLLDEVCEMAPQIQVKLLRVLEEKEFERVGGNKSIKLLARIISATNREVEGEIKNNRFREDLYYRLNTLHIHIPPLRNRREDIETLANHCLSKLLLIHNRKISSFSDEVMEIFFNHPWPGNVRQLQNVIDYAVLSCDTEQIREEHLPVDITEKTPRVRAERRETPVQEEHHIPSMIEKMEREKIVANLKNHKWNKTKTAKELGFTRGQLLYRLKKYGIE